MSDDIILEQDGRILRATFNRTPDNGVSDNMARTFRRRSCRRTKTPIWYCFAARVQISAPVASGTTALFCRRRPMAGTLNTTRFSDVIGRSRTPRYLW